VKTRHLLPKHCYSVNRLWISQWGRDAGDNKRFRTPTDDVSKLTMSVVSWLHDHGKSGPSCTPVLTLREVFSILQLYMDSDLVPNIRQFTPLTRFPTPNQVTHANVYNSIGRQTIVPKYRTTSDILIKHNSFTGSLETSAC